MFSKNDVAARIYIDQKSNSKKRGHNPPSYSKEWLNDWLLNNIEFHRLYDLWVESNYKKDVKPSVDRKDDFLGYTENNIQLMTWGENNKKAKTDMRSGKLISGKPRRIVLQLIDDNIIAEYISVAEASRLTKISQGNISECCNGKRKFSGGFCWIFKDNIEKNKLPILGL